MFLTSEEAWHSGWRGPSVFELHDGALRYVAPIAGWRAGAEVVHLDGTILPGFRDSHVHLGLIDADALVPGGISRVVDLGWDPTVSSTWLRATGEPVADTPGLDIQIAGALLTAPGGYPSRSGWAPDGASREIANAEDGASAVAEMLAFGATTIKIALNSDAGPVWSDELLGAVVARAHAAGLPVVAHAQGVGEALRAARGGVDALAHTPWTERLSDDDVAEVAATCAWISTLDIHGWGQYGRDHDFAVDNLARFAAAGGRVIYGTDLGNGSLPVGINPREIEGLVMAGLGLDAIISALTPSADDFSGRFSFIFGARPTTSDGIAAWLGSATSLAPSDLF